MLCERVASCVCVNVESLAIQVLEFLFQEENVMSSVFGKMSVVLVLLALVSVASADQVALWHFDGDTTDAMGNGSSNTWPYYGTLSNDHQVGTQSWAAIHDGGSAQIRLSLPSDKSINGDNTFGLAMWVKPIASGMYRRLWSFGVGACQLTAFDNLAVGGSARYGISSLGAATLPSWWDQNIRLYEGVWQHFAITADGTTVRVFINNVLKKSFAQTGALTASDNLYLGVQGDLRDNHNGYFDEVIIENGAVGAEWVNDVYTTTSTGANYPVPEPMTVILLSAGVAGLIRRRR